MNEKVKEFIDRMKEAEDEEKRDLLIQLGLSEVKVVRKYSMNRDFIYDKFDDEKRLYYVDNEDLEPIEVSDEEYQEILKYVPIFKRSLGYAHVKENESSISGAIGVLAKIITVVLVLVGLVLFGVFDDYLIWIPICVLISGCMYYPFMMGYSLIVAAAEKILKEK